MGLHRTSPLGWAALLGAAAASAWRAAALWRVGAAAARACSAACGLLALAFALVVWVDRAPLARLHGA